ncbi:hypothetical protein [Mycolicibacterium cosmeticum]|uniref:hypothetical protein n=1 Tax=Mycolicibacterium cosmeticum TaxID=258533 RepID=UPI003204DF23
MAMSRSQLLRLLATLHPQFWEWLHPHVPPIGRGAEAPTPQPWQPAFGPIPDPWAYGNFQLQAQNAVRDVMRRVADAAATVSAQGGDGAAVIERAVDDLVHVDDGDGTGTVPIRDLIPRSWWFEPPRPPRPNEGVELVPALAAAALSFSAIAETVRDPKISAAASTAVDRILDRAEQTYDSLNLRAERLAPVH